MSTVQVPAPHYAAVAAKTASALRGAAEEITRLENENADLRAKVASYEREDRVTKLAKEMEDKGLNSGLTFEEKIASLRTAKDLDRVEDAVKMASAGGIRLAEVSDLPGRGSLDSLTAFCLGQE